MSVQAVTWVDVISLIGSGVTIFMFLVFVYNRVWYTPNFTIGVELEQEKSHKDIPGVEKSLVITYQHNLRATVRLSSLTILYHGFDINIPVAKESVYGTRALEVGVNPVRTNSPAWAFSAPMDSVLPAGGPKEHVVIPISWAEGKTETDIEILLRASVDESELVGMAGMFGAPVRVQRMRKRLKRQ